MRMARLVALVGLAGSGKSVATEVFVKSGFGRVYFGGLTMEKLQEAGLAINEKNERMMREKLRAQHGMAAYALLNIPKIKSALKAGNTIIDGLYSWEEYLVLRKEFPQLEVVAIYTSPKLRHHRLASRLIRPLSNDEAVSRDTAEIEKSHKAGPIAMADITVLNIGSKAAFAKAVKTIIDGEKN